MNYFNKKNDRTKPTQQTQKKVAPKPKTNKPVKSKTTGNSQGNPTPPKRKKKGRSLFAAILRFIGCCICLGIITVSVVAVLVSLYLVDETQKDDIDLNNLELALSSTIYAKNPDTGEWEEYQKLIGEQHREWKELDEISKDLQNAFIAAEDSNFWNHSGISIKRTIYAGFNEVWEMLTGNYFATRQGASTITQQLVKITVEDDATVGIDGYMRKIRELYRAYMLDQEYGKDQILESYLNTVPLTGIQGGVEVGAQDFFGVGVENLTLSQSASLAGITNAPATFNPRTQPAEHLERRDYVLYQMHRNAMITEAEYTAALAEPLVLKEIDREGQVDVTDYSYHTDMVINDVIQGLMAEYNWDEGKAVSELYNKGYNIYSTVDLDVQTAMENKMVTDAAYGDLPLTGDALYPDSPLTYAVDENGKPITELVNGEHVIIEDEDASITGYTKTQNIQGSMVTLNYDGEIVGIVGGVGEKEGARVLNRASDSLRQIGSTMKPIGPYALGVDLDKINFSTAVLDSPVEKDDKGNDWPRNYSGRYLEQPVLVRDAIADSLNTIAVKTLAYVGVDTAFDFMHDTLQIESLVDPNDRNRAPLSLGALTVGMTNVELAGAYMMFGNGGDYVTPHSYIAVENKQGDIILEPEITRTKAIGEDAAMIMNKMLGLVMSEGTASSIGKVSGEMDSVGKTGTTSDNKDHLFVGLTPYYVTAGWMGYDLPFPISWRSIYSDHPPTRIWNEVMEEVQADKEFLAFPTSDNVEQIAYCTVSGTIPNASCPAQAIGYYKIDGSQPAATCNVH